MALQEKNKFRRRVYTLFKDGRAVGNTPKLLFCLRSAYSSCVSMVTLLCHAPVGPAASRISPHSAKNASGLCPNGFFVCVRLILLACLRSRFCANKKPHENKFREVPRQSRVSSFKTCTECRWVAAVPLCCFQHPENPGGLQATAREGRPLKKMWV